GLAGVLSDPSNQDRPHRDRSVSVLHRVERTTAYNDGMGRITVRIVAAIGRALVGAFAGFISVALVTFIATDYFRLDLIENSTAGDRLFNRLISIGAAMGAVVAAAFGTQRITGRLGRTLKGTAWGAVGGVVVGACLGYVSGPLWGP